MNELTSFNNTLFISEIIFYIVTIFGIWLLYKFVKVLLLLEKELKRRNEESKVKD